MIVVLAMAIGGVGPIFAGAATGLSCCKARSRSKIPTFASRGQSPDVQVTAIDSLQIETVKSDSSGLFLIPLHEGTKRGQPITLEFRHPDYFLLDLPEL